MRRIIIPLVFVVLLTIAAVVPVAADGGECGAEAFRQRLRILGIVRSGGQRKVTGPPIFGGLAFALEGVQQALFTPILTFPLKGEGT